MQSMMIFCLEWALYYQLLVVSVAYFIQKPKTLSHETVMLTLNGKEKMLCLRCFVKEEETSVSLSLVIKGTFGIYFIWQKCGMHYMCITSSHTEFDT
jgi:hypothetical protein